MNVDIPCVCPPRTDGAPRHEADTVNLRDRLGFRAGLTVRNTILVLKNDDPNASVAEILASLTEVYLLEGIEGWSIVDQRNKAVEVNRETVRAFMDEHPMEAMTVGNEADTMYQELVLGPLVRMAATSSQPMPTSASTSQENGSAPKPRKRSRPYSISTTPTAGTGPMYSLPGGDSN